MIPEFVWYLISFAIPGIIFYFLTRKRSAWDSVKYTGLYAVSLFGFSLVAGIFITSFGSMGSLFSNVMGIMFAGGLAVNFAAAYLIQKKSTKFKLQKWWLVPIINVLVGLMGLIASIQGLNLFSAMWGGN